MGSGDARFRPGVLELPKARIAALLVFLGQGYAWIRRVNPSAVAGLGWVVIEPQRFVNNYPRFVIGRGWFVIGHRPFVITLGRFVIGRPLFRIEYPRFRSERPQFVMEHPPFMIEQARFVIGHPQFVNMLRWFVKEHPRFVIERCSAVKTRRRFGKADVWLYFAAYDGCLVKGGPAHRACS